MGTRQAWLRANLVVFLLVACAAVPSAAQDASPTAAGTRNAIVGHVVDKDGHPVPGVFVTLLRNEINGNGVSRVVVANVQIGARTDAAGSYRLEHLDLGPYDVVALPENAAAGPDGRPNRAGVGITYHPGTSKLADAKEVMVTINGPAVADITMVPAVLAVVTGTAIGQDNKPLAGGMLTVRHGDNMSGIHARAVRVRPDGSFVLPPLPPGTYILHFHEGPWPPPPGAVPQVSLAKVAVNGRDVGGIKVAPVHRVRATGRIIVDAESRKLLTPATVHINGFPESDGMPGPNGHSTTNDDLSFTFEAWSGSSYIQVRFDDPRWVVKAIRYQGTDVMKNPILFKEGQEVTGLEIEIARVGGR